MQVVLLFLAAGRTREQGTTLREAFLDVQRLQLSECRFAPRNWSLPSHSFARNEIEVTEYDAVKPAAWACVSIAERPFHHWPVDHHKFGTMHMNVRIPKVHQAIITNDLQASQGHTEMPRSAIIFSRSR